MKKLTIALAIIGITSLPITASSQDNIPRGLGHGNNPVHWYDGDCCHMRDCEPVEIGAITQQPDGYHVRYLTSQGYIATGIFAYNSGAVRPSRDGREHACAIVERVICIYIPFSS